MARIIAGSLSSRRLHTPSGSSTRPTSDRVRESVFALLASLLERADLPPQAQLEGLTFLDLYAGSGAMGFEAASRGASPTWVERDRAAAQVIARNQRELQVAGRLARLDVVHYLETVDRSFSIVWMDPPYDLPDSQINLVIDLLVSRDFLDDGGTLLVERSARSPGLEFPEKILNNNKPRRYGDTVVYLAEKGG